ncbi:MAG TPA: universal stress protein, partial [Pricia sp.]|nr:universal stress protein [Pricia sp.]
MKKIILPTDFSANAQKAIDYAIHLFKNEPCKFYLLHAYHSAPSSPGNKQTAKSELKNFTQMLKANRSNEDHHFKAIVITNSIINALEKTIKKKEADYV